MKRHLAGKLAFAIVAAVAAGAVYATVGTAAQTDTAPANSTPPTISGTPGVGDTLTAANGSWSGTNPMTFTYQWERCDSSGGSCSSISSATSQTYTIQSADAGDTLRVAVTATNGAGTGGPVLSDATAVVQAGAAPVNTAAPTLTGTLQQGSTLTVAPGTWSGTAPISYTYQWQRCNGQGVNCTPFMTGSTTTYTLASSDVGNRLQVLVTATNSTGQASKYSNQTGTIGSNVPAPANTAAPAITGTTSQGQTLHVSTGTWSGSSITYAFQWQRCNSQGVNCTAISGATAQAYTLGTADVGNRLQVDVTATNAGGSASKYSNQTGVIGGSGAAIPASSVALPDRLVVSKVSYPNGGHSRTPFVARFRVTDTNNQPVSGALVYLIGLPYGWIRTVPEVTTDATGWATLTLQPTVKMPRSTDLVMFVRARTPQGNVLAGSSTRRLVQVRVRP